MKRVIFILIVTLVGSFAAFIDAFWGLLLYTWYSFASPLELTYGALAGTRLSLLVGALLVATTLYQYRKLCLKHPLTFLLYLYLLLAFSSFASQLRFNLPTILTNLELLAKLIVICALVPVLLTTLHKIRLYVLTIAISGGALGFYYGVFGLFAGSKQIFGPGRIGDNNGYAVFLASLLPFVFFSSRYFPIVQLRVFRGLIASGLVFGNVLALILTYSRGGFIAGGVVLVLLLANIRSALGRILGWGLVLPSLIFATWTIFSVNLDLIELPEETPESGIAQEILHGYVARLRTLRHDVSEEASAGGRLHFWKVALVMVKENPIFGVGMNQFSQQYDRYDFSEGEHGTGRSVHNTPLLIAAELGIAGFATYLGMLAWFWYSLSFAKARLVLVQDDEIVEEITSYISMLRISLIGFLIGGMFVNVPFQEIFWALLSISIAIDHFTRRLIAE